MATKSTTKSKSETQVVAEIGADYKYGFSDPENYFYKSGRGLSREVVEAISAHKDEPDWMRKFRLKSLEYFERRPLPRWGGDMSGIDFGPYVRLYERFRDLIVGRRVPAEPVAETKPPTS